LDYQHDVGSGGFSFLENSLTEMTQIQTHSLQSPLILILGLGQTGVAAARWCLRQGWQLRVADTRLAPAGLAALEALNGQAGIDFRLGEHAFVPELLDGVTQLVLSPGLSPHQEPVKALLERAAEQKLEVLGEIELFARALNQLATTRAYVPKVLGITGTNGKTTVTALTQHMLTTAGIKACAAGNVSPAALDALMDALDAEALPAAWVLELSSFQLETTASLRFTAAVVLNLTQDHLDWHGSMAAYTQAKAKIYQQADLCVYNRDDRAVMQLCPNAGALSVRTFGSDTPVFAHDVGIETNADVNWLTRVEANEFEHEQQHTTPKRKKDVQTPTRAEGRVTRLMPAEALQIKGLHNALNVQVALLLAHAAGAGLGAMLRAAREYQGEPHRMEFIRTIQGVDFFNDSKGTNVGATVAGLNGLARRIILIAGGQGKGQDFSPLVPAVTRHVKHVLLIGQASQELAQVLAGTGVHCELLESLEAAVKKSFELAQSGDAVLLSPACASFDMFKNYPHRGQSFVDAVTELALEQGEFA